MLTDNFGRTFSYLRLSLTSLCNFRCDYCLPNGNVFFPGCKHPLTFPEIERLIRAFSELGIRKVRLTGGEPALRSDLVQIIQLLSALNIKKIALTTNGFRFPQDVDAYYEAGLNALNVSIDSLDPKNFHQITGHNRLKPLIEGVKKALSLGRGDLKVNTVLMRGKNDHEIGDFLKWVQHTPITIRFIELMPTADNPTFFAKHHYDFEILRSRLKEEGWCQDSIEANAGPANVFSHPDFVGRVGLIQPYSNDFCGSCNRLRITSQGELRLCLFGERNHSLRSLLQADKQLEELKYSIRALLCRKESAHRLHEGVYEGTRNFAAIGG